MTRKRILILLIATLVVTIPLTILGTLYLPELLETNESAPYDKRLNEILENPSTSPAPSTKHLNIQLVLHNDGARNIAYRHDPIANTLQQIHPDTDNPTILDPAGRYALLTTGPEDNQAQIYDALSQEIIFTFEGLRRCYWFADGLFWIVADQPFPDHPRLINYGKAPDPREMSRGLPPHNNKLFFAGGIYTAMFVLPCKDQTHNDFLWAVADRCIDWAYQHDLPFQPFPEHGVINAGPWGDGSGATPPFKEWTTGCSNPQPPAQPLPGYFLGMPDYQIMPHHSGGGSITWDNVARRSSGSIPDPRTPFRRQGYDYQGYVQTLTWSSAIYMGANVGTYNIPKDQTFNLLSGADQLLFVQTKPDDTPHNHTLFRLETNGVLTTIADNITGLAINHNLAVYRDDTTLYALPIADGDPTTIATLDPSAPAHAQDLLGARNERGPLLITTPTNHYLLQAWLQETPTGIKLGVETTTPVISSHSP